MGASRAPTWRSEAEEGRAEVASTGRLGRLRRKRLHRPAASRQGLKSLRASLRFTALPAEPPTVRQREGAAELMANGLARAAAFRDVLDAQAAISKLESEGVECSLRAGDANGDPNPVLAHEGEV
jgi:hypothetical protein